MAFWKRRETKRKSDKTNRHGLREWEVLANQTPWPKRSASGPGATLVDRPPRAPLCSGDAAHDGDPSGTVCFLPADETLTIPVRPAPGMDSGLGETQVIPIRPTSVATSAGAFDHFARARALHDQLRTALAHRDGQAVLARLDQHDRQQEGLLGNSGDYYRTIAYLILAQQQSRRVVPARLPDDLRHHAAELREHLEAVPTSVPLTP